MAYLDIVVVELVVHFNTKSVQEALTQKQRVAVERHGGLGPAAVRVRPALE